MTSKRPPNDLKGPTVTSKKNFFAKSHFWACYMSFHRFFGRRVDCAHQIWISSHQMTSKWPLNDLKWPIVTCKRNFLTKSHFGACYMSFHRFFWMLSRLCLSDLSFESPNDLQMTSSDSQGPENNFLTKSHFGACNMSFYMLFWTLSRLCLSDLIFESPNCLRMTSSDP